MTIVTEGSVTCSMLTERKDNDWAGGNCQMRGKKRQKNRQQNTWKPAERTEGTDPTQGGSSPGRYRSGFSLFPLWVTVKSTDKYMWTKTVVFYNKTRHSPSPAHNCASALLEPLLACHPRDPLCFTFLSNSDHLVKLKVKDARVQPL